MPVSVQKFVDLANGALENYFAARQEVMADPRLSPQGKAEKIQALRAAFESKVDEAQRLAKAHLSTVESRVAGAADRLRQEAARERRRLLGDQVAAQIHLEQLRTAPSEDIPEMIEAAASDWDREVMIGFAQAVLAGRPRNAPEVLRARYEIERLIDASQPTELAQALNDERELFHAQRQAEQISVQEMRERPGRLGLNVEMISL